MVLCIKLNSTVFIPIEDVYLTLSVSQLYGYCRKTIKLMLLFSTVHEGVK